MNLSRLIPVKYLSVLFISFMSLVACTTTNKDGTPLTTQEIQSKRQATIEMASTGLDLLTKKNPAVKKEIAEAAGYAVFNTTNVNVVLLVLARGEGVLYDKRRKEPVFMQVLKTGEGLGAGYQQQYQVIIFKSPSAIDQFLLASVDGKQGGVDVEANFSAGSGGIIRSFNPYITFYTVGESGYDLQANYGGSLFLVDEQLNDAAVMKTLPKKSQ